MKQLAAILAVGVLTAWIPQAWPWHAAEAALLFLAAWFAVQRRLLWRNSPWMLALAAGALWPWIQLLAGSSIYAWETHAARLTWTAWLAAYLVAASPSRSRRWMLEAIAMFSIALAPVAIVLRVPSAQYAGFVLLTMPIALWSARGWKYGGPALQVISVFVLGSPIESAMVTLEVFAVLMLRARTRMAVAGVLAATMLLAVGWSARQEHTVSTLEMARDRPVLGWGLGAWYAAHPAYVHSDGGTSGNQAGNDWAQWLAEGGVPFLMAMLFMAGGSVGAGWRTGWGMGLAFVLAHCFIASHFQEPPIFGAVFFAIAGLTREPENY